MFVPLPVWSFCKSIIKEHNLGNLRMIYRVIFPAMTKDNKTVSLAIIEPMAYLDVQRAINS